MNAINYPLSYHTLLNLEKAYTLNDDIISDPEIAEYYEEILANLIDMEKAHSNEMGLFDELIKILRSNKNFRFFKGFR